MSRQFKKIYEIGHLFCFDRSLLPKELKGDEMIRKSQLHTFGVKLYACKTKKELFDGSFVGGIDADCDMDVEAMKKELPDEKIYSTIYYNHRQYDQNSYGNDRLK